MSAATTHTAAQLVQLAQAEAFGILYHHDGGVGNVNAHLNHGGGNHDVGFAPLETVHLIGFGIGRHLAMYDAELVLWHGKTARQAFVAVHQVFQVEAFALVDKGINHIDLPTLGNLLFHKVKQQGALGIGAMGRIRVEHEGLNVKDEKIAAITNKVIGKEITAAELYAVMTDITRCFRSHGYPAATVYIPEQTAVDGRLLVKVEPGRIDKVRLVNESGLKDKAAEKMLAGLKPGDIIRTGKLENALYNLRDLSGVEVQGVLSPGAEQGTSDITVRVTNKKKTSVVLYSENYGSESAGRYRYGLQGEVRNLSGTGDRLNLGALLSNKQQHNYNISYETTLGRSGSRLGFGFSRADYDLGNVFAALGAEGVANTYSMYGRTPLWNTSGSALALTYGYDYRDIKDELKSFGVSWKKHSHAVHLGLDGFGRSLLFPVKLVHILDCDSFVHISTSSQEYFDCDFSINLKNQLFI